jgi:hypothetical protein
MEHLDRLMGPLALCLFGGTLAGLALLLGRFDQKFEPLRSKLLGTPKD